MKKRVLDFIKAIFAEEYVSLSTQQRKSYLKHFELEVFKANPLFKEFAKNVEEIKASGQFKTHLGKEEVVAKTGEVKLSNGFKRHITTFLFEGENPNRYIEVREESRISGIGSVWDIEDEGKLVFLFENKDIYGLDFDVVTVIDNPNITFWQASFFNENGINLGEIVGQKTQEYGKDVYKYDAVVNAMLLGEREERFLKVSSIKTKSQFDYPLLALRKLYSKCPQAFKPVPKELFGENNLER